MLFLAEHENLQNHKRVLGGTLSVLCSNYTPKRQITVCEARLLTVKLLIPLAHCNWDLKIRIAYEFQIRSLPWDLSRSVYITILCETCKQFSLSEYIHISKRG